MAQTLAEAKNSNSLIGSDKKENSYTVEQPSTDAKYITKMAL